MNVQKLFNLENDGKLNMEVNENYLYIRGNLDFYKFDLNEMKIVQKNTVFNKNGKARGMKIFDNFIFLFDFLDLYILQKNDLKILEVFHLGENLSSDILGILWFENPKIYVKIRNGYIYAVDIQTKNIEKTKVTGTSFWSDCVIGNNLYIGTTNGVLYEIDKNNLQIKRNFPITKMNIYSIIHHENMLYTLTQDKKIIEINENFEIVRTVKMAVNNGMANIPGTYDGQHVIADSWKIALWDIKSLQKRKIFDFPTGHYNSGVILTENRLFGHDSHDIYSSIIE